jgi:pyruvate dehydrogenase E1 component
MHRVRAAGKGTKSVRLLGAGAILREALAAAEVLEAEHGVAAEVWSVTSFTELRRDGREVKKAWVTQCLEGGKGPVIAASDYVSALADLIREWVPGKYVTLGTDGFGRSDTRAALRAHFGVDRVGIVKAALEALG